MGSCVSLHKDSESPLGFRFGTGSGSSKDRKLFAAPLPEMEKDQNVEYDGKPVGSGLAFTSASFGSKEETFFDSCAWLDSDCEDDFFSVNGDFIPSGGSTPNFQISTPRTPRLSKSIIDTSADPKSAEPSPRKKLAQLLMETLPGDEARIGEAVDGKGDGNVQANGHQTSEPPTSLDATPYLAGANSISSVERTPNGNSGDGKDKASNAMHCCLPVVVPGFNLYEKKKQKLSPELHNGG